MKDVDDDSGGGDYDNREYYDVDDNDSDDCI